MTKRYRRKERERESNKGKERERDTEKVGWLVLFGFMVYQPLTKRMTRGREREMERKRE